MLSKNRIRIENESVNEMNIEQLNTKTLVFLISIRYVLSLVRVCFNNEQVLWVGSATKL